MWRCEDSRLAHRPREKLLVIAQLAEHSTVVVRLPSSIERSLVRFRLSRLRASRTPRNTPAATMMQWSAYLPSKQDTRVRIPVVALAGRTALWVAQRGAANASSKNAPVFTGGGPWSRWRSAVRLRL